MRTVVMTGAAGRVATQVRPFLGDLVERLILSDRREITDLAPGERFAAAELTDQTAMERLLDGADGLVHLGGFPSEGPWPAIRDANIDGLYTTYEAARRQGVKRIVFASSNHAMGFYPRDQRVDDRTLPRPDSRYGVAKVFGEALGSLYARKFGLRVFNIRIGHVTDRPAEPRQLAIWLHPEDLAQLILIGLEHPAIVDDVVYGMSDCARAWWDNRHAHALGYRPVHRAEDFADRALAEAEPDDPIASRFQGGNTCRREFAGGLAAEE